MRDARQPWLDAGLDILETHGPAVLTIDELARRLGRTKGSYYHHFRSRAGFVDALLRYWEEASTLRIIAAAEAARETAAKKRTLTELTVPLHASRLEVHIRAWALAAPAVRAHVERVDAERLAYVERIALAVTGDAERARTIARAVYAVFVGAQQMLPPVTGRELVELYAELERLYDTP